MLIEGNLIGAVTPAPEPVLVPRLIDGDAVDPGAQARLAAKAVDGAKDAQEDLLGEVEGLVTVAQQVDRQLHDHPLVLGDELGAGSLVARGAAVDQRSLAPSDVRPPDYPGLLHRGVHYIKVRPRPC